MWGMNIEDAFVNWSPNAYQSWKAQRAPTTWLKRAQLEDKEADEFMESANLELRSLFTLDEICQE